jgi:DNA polymerase I
LIRKAENLTADHPAYAYQLATRKDLRAPRTRCGYAQKIGVGVKPLTCSGIQARTSYGIEMATQGEAERYWREFFESYPGLRACHDREYLQLKKHGSTETRTLTGRRRTGVTKLTERLNSPVQGTGADGLKLALALLYERRGECPGAVPILAVHDEVVVECPEEQAEEVKAWLVKAMVDGMDEVLNSGLDTDHPERVPVEVDVKVVDSGGEG